MGPAVGTCMQRLESENRVEEAEEGRTSTETECDDKEDGRPSVDVVVVGGVYSMPQSRRTAQGQTGPQEVERRRNEYAHSTSPELRLGDPTTVLFRGKPVEESMKECQSFPYRANSFQIRPECVQLC